MSIDNDTLRQYIRLTTERRALKDKDDELKTLIAAVEEQLLSQFQQDGVQRMTCDGHTVHLRRELWASAGGDTPGLVAALKAAGLGDLCTETVQAQRLSAWVREFDPQKCLAPEAIVNQLPEEVRPAITVSEVFKLGVRSA